jgi:hypothetical protein
MFVVEFVARVMLTERRIQYAARHVLERVRHRGRLSRYPAPLDSRMIEIGWLTPTSRASSERAVGAS